MVATIVPRRQLRDVGQARTPAPVMCLKGPRVNATAGVAMALVQDLFKVHAGVRVIDLIAVNTTAWATSGAVTSLKVGDSDNTSRFLTSDLWTRALGKKENTQETVGFKYSSSDPTTIQATVTATSDVSTGATDFYLLYTDES